MPNRNDAEGRTSGAGDRERDREVGNETGRSAQSGQAGRRSNRGFASMDRGKQKEIASKGGRAAHAKGTAHEFDSNEARDAGRKGGLAVSRNREHMAMIGRRGGEARGQSRGRSAGPSNTQGGGGNAEGAFQNSRGSLSDRDVTPRAQSEGSMGAASNSSTTRSGTSSIANERSGNQGSGIESSQPSGNERDTFGNH